MLDPSKDYTAINNFELRAYTMARTVITNPPEATTKSVGTAASFFRCRSVGLRFQYQKIDWANIDTAAQWTNASNAFVDILGYDVDQWDIVQFASNKFLLCFQKTGEDFCRHKIYTDGTGWAADVRNGLSQTPPKKIAGIPMYGHAEITLTGGVQTAIEFRADASVADPNMTFSVIGDPTISSFYGTYSKSPVIMGYNASGEMRYYAPLSYYAGIYLYNWSIKYGRAAGAGFKYSVAGDTIFYRENGIISQGYSPYYTKTLYSFVELCTAEYNGMYFHHNGIKYTLVSSSMGQISEFSQDWKKFKCTVPILSQAIPTNCTLYLRRNYVDGTSLDSNPMILDNFFTDVFSKNQFECSRVMDGPAFSPLLHNLAESQPHLLYTHTLPYCPVAVKNQGSTIYGLLNRYHLVMSHDQGQLLVKDNTNPVGTLAYDLYKETNTPSHSIVLSWVTDTLAKVSEVLSGFQPFTFVDLGFITGNVARTAIVKTYALSFNRMTFERPPQNYQVGDVVTIDAATGMIDDIVETFTPNKWRQVLTCLI